jgi:hypothetical protein
VRFGTCAAAGPAAASGLRREHRSKAAGRRAEGGSL